MIRERTTSFFLGLIFGVGLVVSGMSNPNKVLGFLKFWDKWDPSLAFVMMGALSVTATIYYFARRRDRSLLGLQFSWPTKKEIDKPLILGAVVFGIGWGLVGICPGPALTNFAQLNLPFLMFIGSMLAGMMLFQALVKLQR